jgi:hypothetical protein
MKRLRYSDIRPTLARVMDVCNSSASDATILPILNEAHNRLVNRGKWLGTTQSYRICVGNDSCLVWPRQIETIEAFSVCRDPGTLRNQWYEFSEQGPHGLKESNNWFRTMIDKGTAVAFDEIGGDTDTKKLRVTADVTESGTGRMLLQGWGGPNLTDMNWIRTLDGSTWVDGEYVTISTTPQLTTNFFKRLTGVTKPVTNGPVRVFEWETTTSSQIKQLGYYEADEEVPLYRKSFLPGIGNMTGCDGDSSCTSKQITVIAKLRHIDIRGDNDYLLIGNVGALKLAVQATLKEERNLLEESASYWALALSELQSELQAFEGDGAIPILKVEGRDTWGAGVRTTMDDHTYLW